VPPSPPQGNQLSPAIITDAPDSLQPPVNDIIPVIAPDHPIWRLISDLQVENESLQADNEKLTAETDIDAVRARLLRPLAWSVLWFLIIFSGIVFALLICHGFKLGGFSLPDTVLSVLAGTTLAAVAGLVGIILTGLFKTK
jgi:hypothetical protein